MFRKIVSISILVNILLFSLSGCNIYLNLDNYSNYECAYVTGLSYEKITEIFGEPDLINKLPPEYFNSQGENEVVTSVCYKMEKRKLIGFEPTEYCYFGFDPETGLVNVIIRPWYHPDDL